MKINILGTGSGGNCVLATFSKEKSEESDETKKDGRKIIFDFGCTSKFSAWKTFNELNIDYHEIDNVLVTHDHADHNGDYHRIQFLKFPQVCKVKEFEVLHNVPNKGFIVANEATKEAFIYATDYYQIPTESMELIKSFVAFKDWKFMVMLELSYCRWLYNKLDKFQLIGLQNHCSDERFFRYAKEILAVNPAVNIISMHASARQAEYVEGGNKSGEVCPPDWVRDQMYTRFKGLSVRLGLAAGTFGTYNYLTKETKGE